MTTTAGFSCVVQLSETAMQRIVRAMHATGAVAHADSWSTNGRSLQLSCDAPLLTLDPTGPFGEVRATANTRLLCHERPAGPLADPGATCVATAQVRFRARLGSAGDPSPLLADAAVAFDERLTTPSDIVVSYPHPTVAQRVAAAVTELVDTRGDGLSALGGVGNAGFVSAGVRVVPAGVGTHAAVTLGLNRVGAAGTAAALATSFCDSDWAVAVDGAWIIEQLHASIEALYGSRPAPAGPAPVRISVGPGGELWLDSLVALLAFDGLHLSGQLRQESGGLFGTRTANWTARITFTVDSSGRVTGTVANTAVSLVEWYAVLVDFLSGGGIAQQVAAGVASAVADAFGSAGVSRALVDVVGQVSSVAKTTGITIDPRATRLEVRPDAIVTHGTLDAWFRPSAPLAEVRAFLTTDANEIGLSAVGTWAPGGELTALDWQFGDGTGTQTSGQAAAIAVSHVYVPGTYLATLTARDAQGRSSSVSRAVTPGLLRCEMSAGRADETCANDDIVAMVTSSGCPLPGALVHASGVGWSVFARTDQAGRAPLPVTRTQVENQGLPGPKPSRYHIGKFHVAAERAGYASVGLDVWLVDCGKAADDARRARERVAEILDRLAGYAALRDLLGLDDRLTRLMDQLVPQVGPKPRPPGPPPPFDSDPRLTPSVRDRLTDLREAISLYVQLELAQLRATMNDAPEVGGEPRLDTFRKQTLRELDRLAGLFGGDRPFPP